MRGQECCFRSVDRTLDHTTIIHAQKQAKKLFAAEAVRNRVDQIKAEVEA